MPDLGRSKIKPLDFPNLKEPALVLMRSSMVCGLEKIPGIKGARLVYSQWQGYLDKDSPDAARLKSFISKYGLKLELVHTSGHAALDKLKRFADALSPKNLIPIHTFARERYAAFFKNVRVVEDGEVLGL